MVDRIPEAAEMTALIGAVRYRAWTELCDRIDAICEMDHIWSSGSKSWVYEYKYRRGGKTLCALYARENCTGFMVIFGREEREKFEATRHSYPASIQRDYDSAKTYHDGKWVMFDMSDPSLHCELVRLLSVKRRPNRKA